MASSVVAIVGYPGPTMDNMHTRPSVPAVAMCMGPTGQTCTRGNAQNVKKEHLVSGTGRILNIRQIGLGGDKSVHIMAKRKLTAAEKAKKKRLQKAYMTIFINGKQKRVKRPPTIDGMDVDEFIRRNADPIWLHQNERWEYMTDNE
jgi:hypothetical protein